MNKTKNRKAILILWSATAVLSTLNFILNLINDPAFSWNVILHGGCAVLAVVNVVLAIVSLFKDKGSLQ